jgi:hypothetical protein
MPLQFPGVEVAADALASQIEAAERAAADAAVKHIASTSSIGIAQLRATIIDVLATVFGGTCPRAGVVAGRCVNAHPRLVRDVQATRSWASTCCCTCCRGCCSFETCAPLGSCH